MSVYITKYIFNVYSQVVEKSTQTENKSSRAVSPESQVKEGMRTPHISTDEIVIGDNDTLSAFVAVSVEADLLVLLSDIEGLYTSDPRTDKTAKIIPVVDKIDEKIESLCGGKGSELGTGGMITKIHAAKIATSAGVDMIITNGENPESLYDIVEGKNVGTLFRKVK